MTYNLERREYKATIFGTGAESHRLFHFFLKMKLHAQMNSKVTQNKLQE